MGDDIQLLRRYAEDHVDDAFAALVERHISLVYSAALRQLGGSVHRAEEVTQAVFIELARRAGGLVRRDDIVGWLYTTTRHLSSNLKRSEARRQLREQQAFAMHELSSEVSAPIEWGRLQPLLDDAMHELSERDRQAVLRRYFKNERFAEVGATLGLSEDAARMRVERALDKLHVLLAKRGITSTASALGVALANHATAGAPAGLAASVTGAVLNGGAATAGLGSFAAFIYFMNTSKITLSLAAAATLAIGFAIFRMSGASTAASELASARGERTALAASLAEIRKSVAEAERELQTRTVALEEQQRSTPSPEPAAAADASDPAAQAKALRQFLDRDPQLQEMQRDFLRTWRLGAWTPLFQQLRLTPAEIEQTFAELQWRLDQDLQISNTGPSPGLPEALAKDSRFSESLRNPDVREIVDRIVREGAKAGVMFTREQADQLFKTFVELQPSSPAQRDPNRVAMRTYDNWQALRFKLDWEQVVARAGDYLDPAQTNMLLIQAALVRRNKMGLWNQ